jgi:hypothetical protein
MWDSSVMDIQLIYSSVALSDFSDEELDKLLATCVSFNASKNISGMLLYGNGKFIQVLEGKGSDVEALFEKIVADSRHSQVNTLIKTHIRKREFNSWSMGFRRLDSGCSSDLKDFVAFFDKNFDKDGICTQPNLAMALLKAFAFSRVPDSARMP